MRKHAKQWLKSVLAAWGGLESFDAQASKSSGRELRVVLDWKGKRVHVGSLSEEDGQFVFRYSKAFKEQNSIPPISAFPEVGHEYREDGLWPFFLVRLPPTERQDVKQVIAERGLDESDVFELLGSLGSRSITTPYELELSAVGT
jgi:HipA-like protein